MGWYENQVLAHAAGFKKETDMAAPPGKTSNISKLTGIVKNATAAMDRAKMASDALNSGAGALVDKIATIEGITNEVHAANAQLDEAIAAMTSGEESPLPEHDSSSATGPTASPSPQPTPSPSSQASNTNASLVSGAPSGAANAGFSPGPGGAAPLIINTGNAARDVKTSAALVHSSN